MTKIVIGEKLTSNQIENKHCINLFIFIILDQYYLALNVLTNILNIPPIVLTLLYNTIVVCIILRMIRFGIKRTWKCIMISLLFFVILYFSTQKLWPQNIMFFDKSIMTIIRKCLPMLWLAYAVTDFKMFQEISVKNRYWVILGVVAVEILSLVGATDRMEIDYMSLSNSILIGLFLFALCSFTTKKKLDIFLTIVTFIIAAIIGSRGLILCYVAFFVLAYIFTNTKLVSKIFILCLTLVIIFVLVLFEDAIMAYLINLMDSIGIESRNLRQLIYGNMFISSERISIYRVIIRNIQSNLYCGNGLFGDRYILELAGYIGQFGQGSYAHNIILEILCQWGIVFGSFIIVFISYKTLKVLRKSPYATRQIVIVAFSASIIKLLVSGSYLIDPVFYLFIGIILSIKSRGIE